MDHFIPHVEEYLKKSGQTEQELMSGADQYGANFIFNDLVKQALKEHKRIIWYDDPKSDPELPLVLYRFQDL